ncbi:MAG: hypothetical protein ABI378_04640 [Chitinophagaceae bacterium]
MAQTQDSGYSIPKYILPASTDTIEEIVSIDTAIILQKSPLEIEWETQTDSGQNAIQEKGTAGFFPMNGHAVGAGIYAFHSTAARGTVIRVRNLNNNAVAFVKVLGPLPDSKRFSGCIIGLSDKIKTALGVQENKAFCELSYVGY